MFEGYLECPLCDADVLVSHEDKIGDELFCACCLASLKLKKKTDTWDKEDFFLDEDYG